MSNKQHILIIDDEPEISRLIKGYLEREGYTVSAALTGVQGLESFHRHSISMLILDLMLPDMDGLEICRKVRASSNVPVLMLTAKDSNTDKVIGLGIGADDYLTKPFDIHELVARVKALLRRYLSFGKIPDQAVETSLIYSGLSIDRERFHVIANGEAVNLTALEFSLLLFLAENPGRVYTKQQIINHVWSDQTYLDDNTLSVHVRRLRKKIEMNPQQPLFIRTIRGIGYKFNDPAEQNE